jgi:hypothetical protein
MGWELLDGLVPTFARMVKFKTSRGIQTIGLRRE